jgi:hypothetical protein
MSFQAPITLSAAIQRINERRLLLPAIQRNFVWSHSKVEWLFDSILQGYPIGSFLFWEVRDDRSKMEYRYYQFLQFYKENYNTENPHFNTNGHVDFDAVLDGQQRLTALYIGLCGTYAYYKGRVHRANNEHAYPTRKLYLNVLEMAPEDDEQAGRVFEFKFLTDREFNENTSRWFLVARILGLSNHGRFMRMLISDGYQDNEFAVDALSKLQEVVYITPLINFYRIENADMELALNVFVRVNSVEPLSLSDMLMSTAIAQWTVRDARQEIPSLVQEVQEKGFFITKDFVLKACLYLYSPDIRYRVATLTASNVVRFEENWDAIRASIVAVFDLVRNFGYSDNSMTSKNTLLPIVYWVHHKGLAGGLTSETGQGPARDALRLWIHTMLLKGIISGGSADSILTYIRRGFIGKTFGEPYVRPELQYFPSVEIAIILKEHLKDPAITDEFIESLLSTQKDARHAFTILALLSPHLDYRNKFHADHFHPASSFTERNLADAVNAQDRTAATSVRADGLGFYEDTNNWNSILNLGHLDPNQNMSKNAMSLTSWVSREATRLKITQEQICDAHLLPEPSHLAFSEFPIFIADRRRALSDKLRVVLS